MPTDTAPIQTTAAVITSGAEAIRTAREFAASIADGVIERDRSGLGAGPRARGARRQRPAGDHRTAQVSRRRGAGHRARRGDTRDRLGRPGDRADPAGALPPGGRARGARHGRTAAPAVRRGADRRPARQRAGRTRRPSTPRTLRPGCTRRGPLCAADRAQVLLHRGDQGPLDRGHRAGRRRPPGPGLRRARRARRAAGLGLERDGPARHGQRRSAVRRRSGRSRAGHPVPGRVRGPAAVRRAGATGARRDRGRDRARRAAGRRRVRPDQGAPVLRGRTRRVGADR